MREYNEDLFINSYDDEDSDDSFFNKEKELSISEITDNQLKLFIKENSKDVKFIKELYKRDILNNDELLNSFKDCLFKLKDKFNNILIDTYNEHIKISRIYKEETYLRYGNKKLNEWIQTNVFKV